MKLSQKFLSVLLAIIFLQFKLLPQNFSKAIEDNSFLLEEAYNQGENIIQHISLLRFSNSPLKNISYVFTEEYPFKSQAHQFSFTVPYLIKHNDLHSGIGDIYLSYRYQLFTKQDWLSCAPRFSFILPTGNNAYGMGFGSLGVEFNLPASKRISEYFITHFNLGFNSIPNAKINLGNGPENKSIDNYWIGSSLIWLPIYNLNFMIETLFYLENDFNSIGEEVFYFQKYLNFGFRLAVDINNLQIIPGFSIPLFIMGDDVQTNFLFYLSFEHPI